MKLSLCISDSGQRGGGLVRRICFAPTNSSQLRGGEVGTVFINCLADLMANVSLILSASGATPTKCVFPGSVYAKHTAPNGLVRKS